MTSTLADPTMTSTALDLDRLGPGFGADVRGVDLATADDATIVAVRQALTEHKVLFFSRQQLDPDSQVALGNRMGRLTVSHPVVPGLDETHAEIYALDSADEGFADVWHTDVPFVKRPPLGSILRAVTLPPRGGDTNWADLELAFSSLSEPVRRLAEQLTAVHDGTREFGYYLAQRRHGEGSLWEGERYRRLEPVEHPWCGSIPRPGASRCSSTRASPATSSAFRMPRAVTCSTCSTPTSPSPSTSSGTVGGLATSRCGTTGRRRTTPTGTTAALAAACTASRSAVTSPSASRSCVRHGQGRGRAGTVHPGSEPNRSRSGS
jgi:hypothetical protein